MAERVFGLESYRIGRVRSSCTQSCRVVWPRIPSEGPGEGDWKRVAAVLFGWLWVSRQNGMCGEWWRRVGTFGEEIRNPPRE